MAIDDNTSYELTGYQVKDLASKIRAKADSNSLASVATSGLYSDLTGAPTIPTVYNGTLTIQQNGTQLGTFSANQSSDTTINITGGGGASYTAGNGISIDANNEISIDATVVAEVSDLPTDFTGATSSVAGSSGLVPAPTTSDVNKYLSSDGSWAAISDRSPVEFYWYNNDLYTDNLMGDQVDPSDVESLYRNRPLLINNPSNTSFESVISINGGGMINAVVMNYSSNDMVVVQYRYDYGNAVWTRLETNVSYTAGSNITISNGTISATDTTYSNFTGATSSVAGAAGLVPAPAAGDEGKALHGDGTWKDTTAKLVEMSYGESNAWAKFIAAYNAGSIVYCRASSNANPATGSQTRKAFMAYVNNATSPTNVEFQYVRSQSSKSDSQQTDQVFVYTLTNASGGTWSVASRNMGPKIVAGTGMSSTFTTGANATITLNADTMTGATSGAAGTAGVVPAPAAGDQNKVLKADATWGKVGADNIDFTTMPVYTDAVSNIALTTSYATWAKVTIDVPGKYLLLLDASSQSSTSSYALYSRFAIGTSTYNGNYVTVPSGCWGHISNMCVVDISAANTEVKAEFNSTVAVAASSNTRVNLTAVRIG